MAKPEAKLPAPPDIDHRKLRPRKRRKRVPAISKAMLEVWQRAEYRAKQDAHFATRRADVRKRWTRAGIPDGYTRETAAVMWAEARAKALKVLEALQRQGLF